MAAEDLDSPFDAPPPPRFPSRAAAERTVPPTLEPETFTLDPSDDDPSEAPTLPRRTLPPPAAPYVVAQRVVTVEARKPKEEGLLYVAMGLGIACTVLAIAMLLAGGSV